MGRPRKPIKLNERYGKLIVIKESIANFRHVSYECVCDCGNKTIVTGSKLLNGHTKSCGCLKSIATIAFNKTRKGKFRVKPIDFAINSIKACYIANARKSGRVFSLKIEEFKRLILANCSYCNSKPKSIKTIKHNKAKLIYNGIDRVNSDQGYTRENSVTCCIKCNQAKSNLSVKEFKILVTKIYNHWISNG